MKIPARAFITFVLIALPSAPRAVTADLHGFAKNFFVVQDPPAVETSLGDISPDLRVGNNVRVRLVGSVRAASWFEADAAYNVIPRLQNDAAARVSTLLYRAGPSVYRIEDLRPTLAPVTPEDGDNALVLQNLDRLFVTLHAPRFDVYLGRQAIAWGSSKAVSPTDVLAPFLFTEIDTEDRVGVDAVRLRVPTGALGEVDAGYVAGHRMSWKYSAAFLRAKTYVAGTDVSLLGIVYRENALAGLDVTRALGGAGVWCEAAFAGSTGDGSILPERQTYARATLGADYSLHNATYLFMEYHYNGAGTGNAADYATRASQRAYTDGSVYLLGRHYLIPGVVYPATPLITVGGELLVNLEDGSLLVAPNAEYNVIENVYLAAGAFVGLGKKPAASAMTAAVTTPDLFAGTGPVELASEFGTYSDIYFVSVRYYF